MTEKQTFRAYLENLLQAPADEPKVAGRLVAQALDRSDIPTYAFLRSQAIERINISAYTRALAQARAIDGEQQKMQEELGANSEDFIIEALPSNMTLYTPKDIVQATMDFYNARGLRFSGKSGREIKGYEEILNFGDHKLGGAVQLDLGSGFGKKPGLYELWVTTDFYDLTTECGG
ncbi:MAG: hypothetical protein ABH864_01175 [archaeon]